MDAIIEKQISHRLNELSLLRVKWIIECYKKKFNKNNTLGFILDNFDTLTSNVKCTSCTTFELFLYLENSKTLYEICLSYNNRHCTEKPIKYINVMTKNIYYQNFMDNADKKLKLQHELEIIQAENAEFDADEKKIIEEIEKIENEQYKFHMNKFLINHKYSEADNEFFANTVLKNCTIFGEF